MSNIRLSEVSCKNCTHTAVAAEKNWSNVCYVQRDIRGVWPTPEMSVYGLHYGSHDGFCTSKGMYEEENTIIV